VQTRDVIDESTLDPEPFGFSSVFVATEMYFVIYDELIQSFALALVAVAGLSLLILGDVAMVVLICFTVVRRFPFSTFILFYIFPAILSYVSRQLAYSLIIRCSAHI